MNKYIVLMASVCMLAGACTPDRPKPVKRVDTRTGDETTASVAVSADDFDLEYILEWIQGEGDLKELQTVVNNPEYKIHNVDTNDDGNLDFIQVKEHQNADGITVEFIAFPDPNAAKDSTAVASISVRKNQQGQVEVSGQYPEYVQGSQNHYYPPTVMHTNHNSGMSMGQALFLAYLLRPHPVYYGGLGGYGYHPRPVYRGAGSFRSHARSTATTRTTTTTTRKVVKPSASKRPASAKASPSAKRTASRLKAKSGGSSLKSNANTGRSYNKTSATQRNKKAAGARSNSSSSARPKSSVSRPKPSRSTSSPRRSVSPRRSSPSRSYSPSRSSRSFGGGRSFGGSRRSSAQYKTNIEYISDAGVAEVAAAVNDIALTTWEYTDEPGQPYFGLIVEDAQGSPVVEEAVIREDHVDLYGLASMNIAANQVQNQQIEFLMERITALESALTVCQ